MHGNGILALMPTEEFMDECHICSSSFCMLHSNGFLALMPTEEFMDEYHICSSPFCMFSPSPLLGSSLFFFCFALEMM